MLHCSSLDFSHELNTFSPLTPSFLNASFAIFYYFPIGTKDLGFSFLVHRGLMLLHLPPAPCPRGLALRLVPGLQERVPPLTTSCLLELLEASHPGLAVAKEAVHGTWFPGEAASVTQVSAVDPMKASQTSEACKVQGVSPSRNLWGTSWSRDLYPLILQKKTFSMLLQSLGHRQTRFLCKKLSLVTQ